ncbi:MAG: molybdenum ABC transporter ATP-binding protein [Marinibacterium sp.]
MTVRVLLTHRMGDFRLDAAFEAPPGLTVLFGRSGSGKTTTIHAVAGLLHPDRGRIAVDDLVLLDTEKGIDLPVHRRRLGYVFQDGRLFPHLSVRQNLAYGRSFRRGSDRREDPDRIVGLLGLEHLLDRRPGHLSGGEKQRVAIGRALLAEPRLILADEPLAALDEARKAEILPYFERLRDEVSVPILYVTHAPQEVARLATFVVVLEAGQVIRSGPAAEVLGDPAITPAGARAAGAVLEASVKTHHPDGITELEAGGVALFLPRIPQTPGSRIRIRIPASEVVLAHSRPEGLSALNLLPGIIEVVRPGDGPGALVSVRTPAGTVLARVTRRALTNLGLGEGATCYLVVKSVAIAPADIGGPAPAETPLSSG